MHIPTMFILSGIIICLGTLFGMVVRGRDLSLWKALPVAILGVVLVLYGFHLNRPLEIRCGDDAQCWGRLQYHKAVQVCSPLLEGYAVLGPATWVGEVADRFPVWEWANDQRTVLVYRGTNMRFDTNEAQDVPHDYVCHYDLPTQSVVKVGVVEYRPRSLPLRRAE